jgi:hypothetical protein
VLLAAGWLEVGRWVRTRPQWLAGSLASGFAGVSLAAMLFVIRPAYYLPKPAAGDLHGGLPALAIRFGDAAEVVDVRLLNTHLVPGQDAVVLLRWVVLQPTARPLALFVHLLGPQGELLGARESYPGNGRTDTIFWSPGLVIADEYRIPVDAQAALATAPAEVRVEAGLYDPISGERQLVRDERSAAIIDPPILARGKLGPSLEAGTPSGPPLATFGTALQLNAATLPARLSVPGVLNVHLDWTILEPLDCNCAFFAHVVPGGRVQPVAQIDEPILRGRYPPDLWEAGERLFDVQEIKLPGTLVPGRYEVLVGLYNSADLVRLPAEAAQAGLVSDGRLLIGSVQVRQS